jgi:hypothetical protein
MDDRSPYSQDPTRVENLRPTTPLLPLKEEQQKLLSAIDPTTPACALPLHFLFICAYSICQSTLTMAGKHYKTAFFFSAVGIRDCVMITLSLQCFLLLHLFTC